MFLCQKSETKQTITARRLIYQAPLLTPLPHLMGTLKGIERMTQTIVYYLIALNIVTFLVYGIDKWKAKRAKWRIREASLLELAVLGGIITIGSNTQIGPNCQFLTPNHPIDYVERRKPIERCSPITIGEDCWLGGGVTVCPGVTIGDRCIIGAGSVVVKDIPSDSMAVGNPCRVIRKLKEVTE